MNRFLALLLLAGVVAANSTSALSGRQGLVDSLFDAGVGPNRPVRALAIQGTKVLIAGIPALINAHPRGRWPHPD